MSQGLFCGQTESFMDELETFLFLGLKIDAYDAISMQNFPGTSTSVDSNRGHLFVLLRRVVAPLGFILLHLLIANVKFPNLPNVPFSISLILPLEPRDEYDIHTEKGTSESNILIDVMPMETTSIFAHGLEQCDNQIEDLVSKCSKYVQWVGSNPQDVSKDCCAVVKRADVKCVCDHVTEEVDMAVDMDKAVSVAAKCGRPISPGTQCGAYHVHLA